MADARRRPSPKGLTMKMPAVPAPPTITVPPPPNTYRDVGRPHEAGEAFDLEEVEEVEADDEDDEARVTDTDPAPPTDMSNRGEVTSRHDSESGIEVVVVHEDASPRRVRQPWRAFEVWTKNRVYGIDASFVCVEVVDRESGKLDPNHPILGGKLGGGRKRSGKGATFTHPLPLPGTEAMFLRAKKQGYTSAVERVVVRVRALRVRTETTWEQVLQADDDD